MKKEGALFSNIDFASAALQHYIAEYRVAEWKTRTDALRGKPRGRQSLTGLQGIYMFYSGLSTYAPLLSYIIIEDQGSLYNIFHQKISK